MTPGIPDFFFCEKVSFENKSAYKGAQWLSGRVLDARPKGRGFEPYRRHCVLSLSKNINPSLVLVQPRKTRPFITERLLMGRKKSNQTNKQISIPSMQKIVNRHNIFKSSAKHVPVFMILEVRPKIEKKNFVFAVTSSISSIC